MSFIFKVERPQHIKYGYGYYIRFEDDSFYIGATSKFDNGEYKHSKKDESFLKKHSSVRSCTEIHHFGKSENDVWYWEARELYANRDNPLCLNDKMSGGGPKYKVHGRVHLLEEFYSKIVVDTKFDEENQIWSNPHFLLEKDTINSLYNTYRDEDNPYYYQSRFYDIVKNHKLNLIDDIDTAKKEFPAGYMLNWRPVVLLEDYYGEGINCLFDKNHTVVAGWESKTGKYSPIYVIKIPKKVWSELTKNELDYLSKRLNKPTEHSSLRPDEECVKEFLMEQVEKKIQLKSPSVSDELLSWGWSVREQNSLIGKVERKLEIEKDIRKNSKPGYKWKQWGKIEMQLDIDTKYKIPDDHNKKGEPLFSKDSKWKNENDCAYYSSSGNFDFGKLVNGSIYERWTELQGWHNFSQKKKKELSVVRRHITVKVHHPSPTAKSKWVEIWLPHYRKELKDIMREDFPVTVHWEEFDEWVKVRDKEEEEK